MQKLMLGLPDASDPPKPTYEPRSSLRSADTHVFLMGQGPSNAKTRELPKVLHLRKASNMFSAVSDHLPDQTARFASPPDRSGGNGLYPWEAQNTHKTYILGPPDPSGCLGPSKTGTLAAPLKEIETNNMCHSDRRQTIRHGVKH